MKDKLIPMALAITLLCPFRAYSQNGSLTVETGIGGSAINHTRMMVSDFHVTQGGDYVFTLEDKLLYGGINLYYACEVRPSFYADLQGTVGLARYYAGNKMKQGMSLLAGPGLQYRPQVGSGWVQPYLRLGLNFYRKNFPAAYFGMFDDDITKEALWRAEDAWNKGHTFDTDTFLPLSAGIGMVGWITERTGVRIEGDYLRSFGSKGANFAQVSLGVVTCFGSRGRRKPAEVAAKVIERTIEKEVIKEVPVETVREVVREVPSERTLAQLMDNLTFDFDKSEITPEGEKVLDEVAEVIRLFPDDRFLISGHTDAKGSDAYNERLSYARAKAVYDGLVSRGIPEGKLSCMGFGERSAIVPAGAGDDVRRGDRKVVIERVTWGPLWEYLKTNDNR